MTDPNEYQKALREALKYMGQVDKMMAIAVESTKKAYTYMQDHQMDNNGIAVFLVNKNLAEQLTKAIDRPLEGEWWKE